MAEEKQGVVIEEAPVVVEEAPVTLTDIAESMAPQEIELAKKHGLVTEEKPKEEVKSEAKSEETKTKGEEMATRPEVQEAFNDPEKEEVLLKDFNPNEKGLYRKMKKENLKRQAAEAERDHTLMKLRVAEEKAKRLEAENATLKTAKPKAETKEEVDAFGNKIEKEEKGEEDKPLTKADLEKMRQEEEEKKKKEEEANQDKQARAEKLTNILNAQEQDLRAEHGDAEEALVLADKLYKAAAEKRLDSIFPNKKQASKAMKLCIDFFHATANADKFAEGDYSAADIAYELGKMHPEFGKQNDGGVPAKKDEGRLSPDKAKKIVENASKRPSSASITASEGKNFVPYEEMTMEQLVNLSDAEFAKVPRHVRERLLSGAAA